MVAVADEGIAGSYRRQARRLRSIHRRSPGRLQSALHDLALRTDRERPSQTSAQTTFIDAMPASSPTPAARQFASAITAALDGPILRYSQRQQLIRQAETMGISRFDANLLIAAVQHRFPKHQPTPRSSTRRAIQLPPRNLDRWLAVPLGAVIVLQTLIALGAYLLIHGS